MVKTITYIAILAIFCSFVSCSSNPPSDKKSESEKKSITEEQPTATESSFVTDDKLKEFETLHAQNPADYPSASMLAVAYANIGRPEDAERLYNEFIKSDDPQTANRAKLDRAIFFTDQKRFDDAYGDFMEITECEFPDLKSEAYFQLGDLISVNKYQPPDGEMVALAIEYYGKASELEPSNAILYRRLADLMYSNGDLESARKYLAIFIVVYPEDWNSWLDLAAWSVEAGDTDNAKEYYKRAMQSGIPDIESKASKALERL